MAKHTIDPTAAAAASARNTIASGLGSVTMSSTTHATAVAMSNAAMKNGVQAVPRRAAGTGTTGDVGAAGEAGIAAGGAGCVPGPANAAARRARITSTWRITTRQKPTPAIARLNMNPIANAVLTALSRLKLS